MMKLRYHHLLCIPRFQGKGYSEEFCKNMSRIKSAFESGEEYTLVEDCDDVCTFCPNNVEGTCIENEKVSRYDLAVKAAVECGRIPTPQEICSDCQWYEICKDLG